MSTTFDHAVEKTGREYLELEVELRRSVQIDPGEREALHQAALSHPDPIGRLLATVVLDWAGPKETDFKAALDYLVQAPIKLAGTALGSPSAMGVEAYLTLHFAERVAELMALRLVKEKGWPRWKTVGIIFHLMEHKLPSTTSALIRFSIETPYDPWREFALEAIREIKDPALGVKVAFEVERAKRLGRVVPVDVGALAD